jgi:alcohol dehydrogenase
MIGAALGANVIAVDVEDAALALAREFGAEHTINARATDPAEAIHELTSVGADVSIDAVGSAVTCAASIASLRKRGRHVQVGLLLGPDARPPIPMQHVLAHELDVVGVHGMAVRHYPALLQLVGSGTVNPGRLVRRRIILDEVGDALAAMGRGGAEGITVIDRFRPPD